MRKGVAAAVVLLALLVGGAMLAAANLNSWLNENREWLASEGERAVGRRLSFGELDVSIWTGFGVRVADVRIGDDPAFSEGDFVSAGMVEVRVAILPALFGEIEVGRVVLREPTIRVIQTAQGLSVDSLGAAGSAPSPEAEAPAPTDATSSGASQAIALTVSLIDVQGGHFEFIDQTVSPPAVFALTQVDFSASDVSLTAPITFDLRAAALGAEQQNIEVSGTVGPVSADPDDLRLDLNVSIGPLSMTHLMALAPVKEAVPPGSSAGGTLEIETQLVGSLESLTVDGLLDASDVAFAVSGSETEGDQILKPGGSTLKFEWSLVRRGNAVDISKADLHIGETSIHLEAKVEEISPTPRATLSVRSDRIRLADLGVAATEGLPEDEIRNLTLEAQLEIPERGPKVSAALKSPSGVVSGAEYTDLAFDFEFANERATIEKLALGVFAGTVRVGGYYDLSDELPTFDLDTKLANVSIAELLESQAPLMSGRMEGVLAANLSLRGRGSEWEEIREVLTGTGNLIMENGTLNEVNLADSVMEGIVGVPGLSNLVDAEIRQKYPAVFGAGETVFEKLDAKLDIRDGTARVRDFRLAARDYSLTGEGKYELRDELDMRVAMTLSEPLTGDLVDSMKEARYLKNSNGRIEIPVRLRGGVSDVRAEPDLRKVAQALQKEVLGDLLQKALGSPSSEGEAGTSDGQELLKRGLEGLFGGGRK